VLIKALAPFRERRKELEANPLKLEKILAEGKKAASEIARATSQEVRKAMHISSAQG